MSDPTPIRPGEVGLAAATRYVPQLSPADSLARASAILRGTGLDTLPVLDQQGRLVGELTTRALVAAGQEATGNQAQSIGPLVTAADTAPNTLSAQAALAQMRRQGTSTLHIVDGHGRYVGMLAAIDLIAPPTLPVRPHSAGGMATPWGVYLTAGTVRAGASNAMLVAAGLCLGLVLAASQGVIGFTLLGMERLFHTRLIDLWLLDDPNKLGLSRALAWLGVQAAGLPVFLLLLRSLPLARYHAAEHMCVHALERGEPLVLEVASRMPRIHPRCGTNLIGATITFVGITQVVTVLRPAGLDAATGALLGAAVAAFSWRSIGAMLQQHFTTRQPDRKHLEAGLRTAIELEQRFQQSPPGPVGLRRRIWNSGAPQTLVGAVIGAGGTLYLLDMALRALR